MTLNTFSFSKASAIFSGLTTHVLIWTCFFYMYICSHDWLGSHLIFGRGGGLLGCLWSSNGVPLVLEWELCRMVKSDVLFATFNLPALMSSVFYRPYASFQNGCCIRSICLLVVLFVINKLYHIMAMSNLYSKIAPKPVKRLQDISVSQTNAWVNGKLL